MRGGADTVFHACSQQIKLMVVGKITKEAEKDTAKVSRHHAAIFRLDKPWEYDTIHVNLQYS